jgi:hypothetical protein
MHPVGLKDFFGRFSVTGAGRMTASSLKKQSELTSRSHKASSICDPCVILATFACAVPSYDIAAFDPQE